MQVGRDGSEEAVDGWAARAARQLKPDSIVILLDECAPPFNIRCMVPAAGAADGMQSVGAMSARG